MTKNKLNIEELYRSQFDKYRVEPSYFVWEGVQQKLFWKQFLAFRLNSFNIYYTLVAIAIPVTIAFISFSRNNNIFSDKPAEKGQAIQYPMKVGTQDNTDEQFKTLNSEATYQNIDSSVDQQWTRKTGDRNKEAGTDNKLKSGGINTSPDQEELIEIPQRESADSEELTASAAFTASALSGCSPLAVSFLNESENAKTWYWTFGDGGSSTEEHPSWVFDEPGEFTVRLQVSGTDEIVRQENKTIIVWPAPRVVFEFDKDINLAAGQPVYFYNYTRDAEYFEWNFGDNTRSFLSDPVHYYDNPGNYNITLKAWNIYQCYDSLTVRDAFSDDGFSIQFPTAFAPNPAGPSGGFYTENGTNNEVFHPLVTGELIEYNLKIFNRLGMLLFESNDLGIGWDGYYLQQLLPQDVYLWKARGKFSGGKTFIQAGDITLISKK
jgi:gliding motility-associated-like protein